MTNKSSFLPKILATDKSRFYKFMVNEMHFLVHPLRNPFFIRTFCGIQNPHLVGIFCDRQNPLFTQKAYNRQKRHLLEYFITDKMYFLPEHFVVGKVHFLVNPMRSLFHLNILFQIISTFCSNILRQTVTFCGRQNTLSI